MERTQVLIVGAGPSGLTVAAELALAGCDVRVLERRQSEVESRAGTVLPRVLELLDYRDLAQEFIEKARQIRDDPLIPFHIWAGLQPIWWRHLHSSYGYRLVLQQNTTEDLLRQRAEALGVTPRYGRTVVDLEQSDGGVVLTAELADGTLERYTGDYVVGTDGGRSAVRRLAGIPFEGNDETFTGVIADVRVNMHWPEGRAMVDNDRGWAASFPFAENGEITRFNFVHAERRQADRSEPVTADEVRRCLREIFERDIEFTELEWASRFTDAMRSVPSLRRQRVLLVGESARIHYPASGVGMNFCIQDGFNLAWKLALVTRGRASATVLDTYDEERLPVMRDLLESVQAQIALQFNFSREGIALKRLVARDLLPLPQVGRAIAQQLNGIARSYPTARGSHPLVGHPIQEASVQTRRGIVRLAELLRTGSFALVDLTGGDAFLGLGCDEVSVESGPLVGSPETYVGVTAILIRPDGYLHWVSTDANPRPEDASEALADWLVTADAQEVGPSQLERQPASRRGRIRTRKEVRA